MVLIKPQISKISRYLPKSNELPFGHSVQTADCMISILIRPKRGMMRRKSPSLFLRRIVISCLVKHDRMCLSLPNNKIDDWASSYGFLWSSQAKTAEQAQSIISLLQRIRYILSHLTKKEMIIRRNKSDGLFVKFNFLMLTQLSKIRSCYRESDEFNFSPK